MQMIVNKPITEAEVMRIALTNFRGNLGSMLRKYRTQLAWCLEDERDMKQAELLARDIPVIKDLYRKEKHDIRQRGKTSRT